MVANSLVTRYEKDGGMAQLSPVNSDIPPRKQMKASRKLDKNGGWFQEEALGAFNS